MRSNQLLCQSSGGSGSVPTVFLLLSFLLFAAEASAGPADWKIEKSRHFIVHYRGDESVARATLEQAEGYYRDILEQLAFKRYDEFWLWDKRVQIRIYDSMEEFRAATGSPKWAAGKVSYARRVIEGIKGEKEFFEGLLPHEMAHLILRDYIGFDSSVPLWLEEGVASWVAAGRREEDLAIVRELLKTGKLMTLDKLTTVDVRETASMVRARQFYAQSATLVAFLMQAGDSDTFASFCRALRDGKSLDEGLKSAYGDRLGSLGNLQTEWLKWLTPPPAPAAEE